MKEQELPIEVKRINRLLQDHFGLETSTNEPIWRVSWSDDQYEKRLTNTTKGGLQLLFPEVQELPKYDYIEHKYILERLVVIPEIQAHELPTSKLSYECLYIFEDVNGNALPPKFEACKFVVDMIYAHQGKKSLHKYTTIEGDPIKRFQELEEALFGNETDVADALHHREGITVPENKGVEK